MRTFRAKKHAAASLGRRVWKTERVWQRDYANHVEAMRDMADYIVASCISVRLHSKLGNLPANAFEHQFGNQSTYGCVRKN